MRSLRFPRQRCYPPMNAFRFVRPLSFSCHSSSTQVLSKISVSSRCVLQHCYYLIVLASLCILLGQIVQLPSREHLLSYKNKSNGCDADSPCHDSDYYDLELQIVRLSFYAHYCWHFYLKPSKISLRSI